MKIGIAAITLLAALNSPAASGDWTNNAAGNWSVATNWSSNPSVPGTDAGDIVGLNFDITGARTITINTNSRTVGTLILGDPGTNYFVYTLAANGGANLTFNNNGNGALLSKPTAINTALDVISTPIVLADNLVIDTAVTGNSNSGLSLQITGLITENGGVRTVTKNGPGGVRIDQPNTFSGGVTLNSGEIQLGSSIALGTGRFTANGGSLASRSANRNLTNAVTINADFTLHSANAGGNQLTLSGPVDFGAATRTLTVASAGDTHIPGIISATGPAVGLTKAGGSVLNLSGANTFGGDTRIAAGSLQLSPTTGAAAGTSLALQYSTLDMNSADAGTLGFRGSAGTSAAVLGGLKGSRNINLQTNASVATGIALSVGNNGQSTTYSGVLSGANATLTKIGAGTLVLSGANTYTGLTTVSSGSLQLGDGGASGSLASSGYVQIDSNLTVNRNNVAVQGVDFSASPITGSGSFTQAGSGTTILNAANSYSGATTVSAGKLVVSSDQSAPGATTVADGATLGITTSFGQWQPASLTLGTSAYCSLEFNNIANPGTTFAPLNPSFVTRNSPVTINVRSLNGAITVGGTGYPLLGNMSGSTAGFTLGTQPPGVGGHLAVSGTTLTYVVDTTSDIWASGDPINPTFWDIGTSANWAGNAAKNTPVNTFAQNDNVLFNDNAPNPQTVTVVAEVAPSVVNVDNTLTEYSITSAGGSISGAGTLNKSGTGTLKVAGPNTYSGGTTLAAGQLDINDGGTSSANSPIGTGPLTISGGKLGNSGFADVTLLANNPQFWNGDFGFAGNFNLNLGTGPVTPNNSRTINVSANTLTVAGPIGGGAISLTKTGNGALTLAGANSFSGGVTLSAGQLNINNANALGSGILTINGGIIDNTSGSNLALAQNNPQAWNASFTYAGTSGSLNLGTGPVSMPVTTTVTVDGNTLTVGGVITSAGGLTKAGNGALALMSANNFGNNGAFDMAVSAGTLIIGNDLALGTSRLNLADGVTIQSSDSTARVINNRLNFGSGAGGNTIFAGTGNLTFSGAANNGTSKTLTVNNPVTEFSGVLSGNMARTFAGTGKLILSGANSWSQGSTITSGATVQLGNGGTSGSLSTSGSIVNDGTLIFDRSDAIVQGVHFSTAPITGFGSIVQAGSGSTTLTAANTFAGPMTVNNGELFITPAHQAGGDVLVAAGAKFGVSAASSATTALINSLTLGNNTTLDFSYSSTGNPTNAVLMANTLSINGICHIRVGGSFTVGTFPVLKYETMSGNFNALVEGPRGVSAGLFTDTVNKIVYISVTAVGDGIVWTGTNSVSPNLWDLNTTPNWLSGLAPTPYIETVPPGDRVSFNDQGSSYVMLNSTVNPAKMTINNNTASYLFEGSGQINALGGFVKTGAGSVTMNLPGNFSTSTVLSNGLFSIGANFSFDNLSGDSALAVSSGSRTLTLNNTLNTTFAGNIAGSLSLTKTGDGVLTLGGSNNIAGTILSKAGSMVIQSGSITQNGYTSIGHTATDVSSLTLKGSAAFTNNNDFNIGDVGSAAGTLNVQDGASLTVNAFFVGSANASGSTASGTVNQTGGTVTQLATATGNFAIGGRTETTSLLGLGVYNMSGGVLNVAGPIRLGAAGTGTFNQSGGFVNVGVDVNISRFAGSSGTYNLNGGTIRTARMTSSTGISATLNLNGGVLLAREDNTSIILNIPGVYVRNGGAIIDTTNLNVTVGSPLQHSIVVEDHAIDGGLTKRGAGTLTLGDALYASYTGPTVVSEGALAVYPASVNSLNELTVSNAALNLRVPGGFGSVNAGNVKLLGNSSLNLNFDMVYGAPAPALNASGSLSATGTTTINVFGYGWTVGQFTLVDYSGTPLPNLSQFVLGSLPYGVTATLANNTANSSIDLVVTGVGSLNWISLTATDPAGFSSFNSAGFWQDGNLPAAGNGYFTKAFAIRSPNDANSYTFGGSALSLDVGGRFLMKGTGGQTITVDNLILNGGIVDYANGGDSFTQTLAGNILLQGGITSYLGALGSSTGANSETLFVIAPITGTGSLQLAGTAVNGSADNGVVVFSANNTYTGATTVAGGTLLVNGANGNSPVTVTGSATLGGSGSIAGPVSIHAGARLAPGTLNRGALTAALGSLTLNGGATVNGAILMKLDRSAVPSSDRVIAPSIIINAGATLVVTNIGSAPLVAGDTFAFFSSPVAGPFSAITLPTLADTALYWTNKLALDGTIAVASKVTVNPNPTNITSTLVGNKLTLTWPADYLGWRLQVQTNAPSTGLGSNWSDVAGSDQVTSIEVTLDPAAGSVFYRMVYP